jgi:hypothetical protein
VGVVKGGEVSGEARIYYTVRAVQRKTNDSTHDPQRGDFIWLDWTEEGGGWSQWNGTNAVACHYQSAEGALEAAKRADGMPWWFRPDMRTLRAFKITYHPAWRELSEL